MPIRQFSVSGVRNLASLTISPHPRVNFIYGENGSGKTSLLEAISLIASGKSFRNRNLKPVFHFDAEQLELSVQLDDAVRGLCQLQMNKAKNGDTLLKQDGSVLASQADAAHWLPVQVMDPMTFKLLTGSPEERRQFIDWGVFHVEPDFLPAWKVFKRQLQQRNAVLKQQDASQLKVWNQAFAKAAAVIDDFRQQYLKRLMPEFQRFLAALDPNLEVSLSYGRGWDKDSELLTVLERQQERDLKVGHTQAGPQRAELRVKQGKYNVVDVLSRGQQKTVVAALKLSQGHLFQQDTGRSTIYLVDDLASELDEKHRVALCQLLEELKCQVFITSIDRQQLMNIWQPASHSMFHMEQGHIRQQN